MSKFLDNEKLNNTIIMIFLAISLAIVLIGVYRGSSLTVNLGIGFAMLYVMLFIANKTFIKMDTATQKTINALEKIVGELKSSATELKGISENLKVLSKEVEERGKAKPNLSVRFNGGLEEIRVKTGDENEVKLLFDNIGKITAMNPVFEVYFPPEIEIIESTGSNVQTRKIPRDNSDFPNHTCIYYIYDKLPGGPSHYSNTVKLKIQKASIKKIKIPFRCTCDDVYPSRGTLTIDAIG